MSTEPPSDEHPSPWSDAEESIDEFHDAARPGYRLGEATQQAHENPPEQWPNDAYEMRRHFGLPEFSTEAYTRINAGAVVLPDIIRHRRNPTKTPTEKGTATLIRAKKNFGKTTFLGGLVPRLLENNTERVIHRGRPDDSGWLRLRWWATVWLPTNAAIDATWVHEMTETQSRNPIPTERLGDELAAREVRYYESVQDLIDQLAETPTSTYHVVYPDPSFTGCERVMRDTPRIGEVPPYYPEWETDASTSPTPLPYWWHAFIVEQVENGHFDAFMSLLADEAQQIFPPNPPQDDHLSDRRMDLMQQVLNEARKRMFSWYIATQKESKIDYRVHEEVETRVYLADGRPNPTKHRRSSLPPKWEVVPMDAEFMSEKPKGRALCFIEAAKKGYVEFDFDDLTEYDHPDDQHRWLKIELREPAEFHASQDRGREAEATLQFDESVFQHYDMGSPERLYVSVGPTDLGRGRINLATGEIEVALEWPTQDAEFRDELAVTSEYLEVRLVRSDGEETLARIPKDRVDSTASEVTA